MDRPFDEIELADALRPFGQSRMQRAAAYTSARMLAWERRHLFAGGWTCVGRQPDPAVTRWAVTDRVCCVVGSTGVVNLDSGPDQVAWASSLNAAVIRSAGEASIPRS
jgi:hypothetical protein